MLADSPPAGATDAGCVARELENDQAYLVETARRGSTMVRQRPALAITRLHPTFVHRLAEAIREARDAGLPAAGIFSAYRPPAFGVGGFSDKFNSLHTYGLAVDMLGIGRPGTSEAKRWHEIAARHGIVCPYGADDRREWNHCQPTRVKIILAGNPLRGTVSPRGPVDLKAMFAGGDTLVSGDARAGSPEPLPAGDQARASRTQEQPRTRALVGSRKSIGTGHDQTDPSHEPHRQLKPVAGSVARSVDNPGLDEAHAQAKRPITGGDPSVKSGPLRNYRISSLFIRDSSGANFRLGSSKENALAKRIKDEDAQLDRLLKSICRGC